MNIILFAIIAIAVYVLADWIVVLFEKRRGEALANRQIIFFIVFFTLILVAFELLKLLLANYAE